MATVRRAKSETCCRARRRDYEGKMDVFEMSLVPKALYPPFGVWKRGDGTGT